MYRVTKRDGSITEFHIAKIGNAITRAFEAVGRQQHPSVIELLALRVTAEFEPKIRNELISVEDIQDCVERVLSEAGYSDVAKAYILYRKSGKSCATSEAPCSIIRSWWTIISGSTTGA